MRFEVEGLPGYKGRPRFVVRGKHAKVYTDSKTKEYEARVRAAAKPHFPATLPGPVAVTIRAWYPMRGQPLKRSTREPEPRLTKPDVDNVAKAVLDGMNGVAYQDDSVVFRLTVDKWYCGQERNEPRVSVEVEQM